MRGCSYIYLGYRAAHFWASLGLQESDLVLGSARTTRGTASELTRGAGATLRYLIEMQLWGMQGRLTDEHERQPTSTARIALNGRLVDHRHRGA